MHLRRIGVYLPAAACIGSMTLSGCLLDYSGLTGGEGTATTLDGGLDAEDETVAQDAESGSDAGCAVLSCGTCQACPAEGCLGSVLVTGSAFADSPRGIAVTADALYWVNEGSGQLVRLADGVGGPEVIASSDAPQVVAASAEDVVWSDRQGVWGCAVGSCEASRRKLGESLAEGSVQGIVLQGKTAYWTDRGSGTTAQDGAVRRCNIESCATPETVEASAFLPQGVLVAGGWLFWASQGDGFETGAIFKVPRDGQGILDVAQALRKPGGLAADDTYLYWSRWTADGRIFRCEHSAGFCEAPVDVVPAAGDLGHPLDVAVAGARLYFGTIDDGSIRSCALPGCGQGAPASHVSGRGGIRRFVVGSECIFWTEGEGGGSVMKAAR